ncbi:lipopolysaccharide biosynthesis protein [Rhizobium sp. L1K21]|nr:lipopolysaccharide biosynthesis protein [Rhizobium sp. L1K21]MCO6188193.1 lipopolysaccharide biosynthesis protein [Rhizobium sp. L1K21]
MKGTDPQARAQRMALFAFAIRVTGAAIAFLSQVILARLMGDFEYGIFVFVWVLAILLGNFSCLGFHTAIIRFLPQYQSAGDNAKIRGLASAARTIAMLAATGVAAVGAAGLYVFGDFVESYYVIPLYLGAVCLPLIALGDVMDGTGRANAWPIGSLAPTFIVRPTLIIVFMVIAAWLGAEHTARVAMICALAATYVTSIGQFFIVAWRMRRNFPSDMRETEIPLWFRMALPIFLIESIYFLLTNSDVVVVGIFLTPEQVAIYFAAAKVMALVHFVLFAVKAAASARFSAIYSEGNRQDLADFAVQAARWTFWPSLAIGLFILAIGNFLLSLFGPNFTEGYTMLTILLIGILAKASIGPGEGLLTMAGEQNLCVKIYAFALASNITLSVLLIPLIGLPGAAIATAGAMIIEATLLSLGAYFRLGFLLTAFSRPILSAPAGNGK